MGAFYRGLPALIQRSENNLKAMEDFVAAHDWIHFLASDRKIRSSTSVCLTVDLPPERLKKVIALMAEEQAAYDIASYREAPPGLRFWCGATVERSDLELALQWLQWAYNEVTGSQCWVSAQAGFPACALLSAPQMRCESPGDAADGDQTSSARAAKLVALRPGSEEPRG